MSPYFYRIWLPVSLVVHLVLFVLLRFIPLPAAQVSGDTVHRVSMIADMTALPAIAPTLPDLEATPPPPAPKPLPLPAKKAGKVNTVGATMPRLPVNHGTTTPGPRIANKPLAPVGPGTAKVHANAMPVLTTKTSHTEVPATQRPSTTAGTGGPGTKPEGGGSGDGGATYGAVAETRGVAYYPKDAENSGREGTVTILVSLNSAGEVDGVDVSESSGAADLDQAAMRAAKRSRFKPSVRDGKPVSSTAHLIYTFANGKVTSKQLP
ncbi:MAG TPA: energy transducer TonB [Armatimonadota bacterium]|jgi:protein TonB